MPPPGDAAAAHPRLPLVWLLILSFGSLIAVSIAVVLGVAVYSGGRNTVDLLRDRADLGVGALTREIERHLETARSQVAFVALAMESGRVDPDDREAMGELLFGATAAAPDLDGLIYLFADGEALIGDRTDRLAEVRTEDLSQDPAAQAALRLGRRGGGESWAPPIYRPDFDNSILTLRRPVFRDGRFHGVLAAAIGVRTLSDYLAHPDARLGPDAFVLLGREQVLAHRLMAEGYPGLSLRQPLPLRAGFQDAVLARMWDEEAMRPATIRLRPPLENHHVEVEGERYMFLYRELDAYTATPLLVGAYFHAEAIGSEVIRLLNAFLVGLAALLLAVALAWLIGRRLARPARRLSTVARQVGELRLDEIGELPRSRVMELDEQSRAFNAMVGALRWFQAYVPRALVHRLMRDGDLASLQSNRRHVTVMFTDIAGYSTLSEGKSAAEIAALLNAHFGILTRAIEAEGGTVDKFIGDSVMAFWGAPEKQKNRAVRACRAALAIRAGVAADNRQRLARGEPPVRLRIGVHSGEATAGNIGAAGRLNYTVIGDDVNIAQRLEQLGRQVSPDAEVAITLSAATVAHLHGRFEVEPVGETAVKGRAASVAVWRLVQEAEPR